MEAKEITSAITNYLNSFSNKSEAFNQAMSNEHRTLQQTFTKLCLAWIEHVASEEYRVDGRNEASKNTCKDILKGFERIQSEKGYSGETLRFMSKASGHLPLV
jgi:hypothetical protein